MKCWVRFFICVDMPVFVMHGFSLLGLQPRKKGWMSQIQTVGFDFKMLCNVSLDFGLDLLVHIKVSRFEQIRVRFVYVDKLGATRERSAV